MRYIRWFSIIVVGLVWGGCESVQQEQSANPTGSTGPQESAGSGEIVFQVTFAPWHPGAAKVADIAAIDRITAYVYTSGGTELASPDMEIDGDAYSGRITVDAQDDLRVVLAFFDGSIVRWLGQDSDVDVVAGEEETAVIVEEYMGTSVTAPATADVGQAYTVSWTERPMVTGYELQEATQSDFSDAATVYSDASVSKEIAGKPQSGVTYYYRARTTTEYGNGPWHSTGDASTGIEAEAGTIIIEGVLPSDEPSEGELTVTLPGGATMQMVWINPGTFTMGSPDADAEDDEKPQHEVTISQGFYLGKYEITQGQWQSAMETTPWLRDSGVQAYATHPAVYVSFVDVAGFIQQLNTAAGEEFYWLPTEAEWEYACRAGTTTPWSFGDDVGMLGDYAWYIANANDAGEEYAHQVGTKLPNPWGLYDMHGNVFEWCKDWNGPYTSDSQIDPQGPDSGIDRIGRGGAFHVSAGMLRSAERWNSSLFQAHYIGARVLRIR